MLDTLQTRLSDFPEAHCIWNIPVQIETVAPGFICDGEQHLGGKTIVRLDEVRTPGMQRADQVPTFLRGVRSVELGDATRAALPQPVVGNT
jgi:hypothetical protein